MLSGVVRAGITDSGGEAGRDAGALLVYFSLLAGWVKYTEIREVGICWSWHRR